MTYKEGFLWLQEMIRGAQHDRMSCLVYGFSYTSELTIYSIFFSLPWLAACIQYQKLVLLNIYYYFSIGGVKATQKKVVKRCVVC